ncbi:hypothetical protein AMAG_01748 [Allomyces macrogynus ATCC 38327]|uniref:Ras-associating domain-containing protein n=1 Tax=Allomyces macrogynus (strain ATCC 38327) TaxID=578462 RepID=A0A0L0S0I8_ALLM3|nr:hypothetical protein AMAG_01748 [Allomyces macrogynus ATCC 38327]|eukprot:KNE55881.1 hypothetical protein AMAG_01748 [Allomyces macrogynus ATCC 38327]
MASKQIDFDRLLAELDAISKEPDAPIPLPAAPTSPIDHASDPPNAARTSDPPAIDPRAFLPLSLRRADASVLFCSLPVICTFDSSPAHFSTGSQDGHGAGASIIDLHLHADHDELAGPLDAHSASSTGSSQLSPISRERKLSLTSALAANHAPPPTKTSLYDVPPLDRALAQPSLPPLTAVSPAATDSTATSTAPSSPTRGGFRDTSPTRGGFRDTSPTRGGFRDTSPTRGGFRDTSPTQMPLQLSPMVAAPSRPDADDEQNQQDSPVIDRIEQVAAIKKVSALRARFDAPNAAGNSPSVVPRGVRTPPSGARTQLRSDRASTAADTRSGLGKHHHHQSMTSVAASPTALPLARNVHERSSSSNSSNINNANSRSMPMLADMPASKVKSMTSLFEPPAPSSVPQSCQGSTETVEEENSQDQFVDAASAALAESATKSTSRGGSPSSPTRNESTTGQAPWLRPAQHAPIPMTVNSMRRRSSHPVLHMERIDAEPDSDASSAHSTASRSAGPPSKPPPIPSPLPPTLPRTAVPVPLPPPTAVSGPAAEPVASTTGVGPNGRRPSLHELAGAPPRRSSLSAASGQPDVPPAAPSTGQRRPSLHELAGVPERRSSISAASTAFPPTATTVTPAAPGPAPVIPLPPPPAVPSTPATAPHAPHHHHHSHNLHVSTSISITQMLDELVGDLDGSGNSTATSHPFPICAPSPATAYSDMRQSASHHDTLTRAEYNAPPNRAASVASLAQLGTSTDQLGGSTNALVSQDALGSTDQLKPMAPKAHTVVFEEIDVIDTINTLAADLESLFVRGEAAGQLATLLRHRSASAASTRDGSRCPTPGGGLPAVPLLPSPNEVLADRAPVAPPPSVPSMAAAPATVPAPSVQAPAPAGKPGAVSALGKLSLSSPHLTAAEDKWERAQRAEEKKQRELLQSMGINPSDPRVASALEKLAQARVQRVAAKIYIGDTSQAKTLMLTSLMTAELVTEWVVQKANLDRHQADQWTLFELFHDLGVERPLKNWELVTDVLRTWERDTDNALLLRRYGYKSSLTPNALKIFYPPVAGWLHWEAKRGQFKKRYVELRPGAEVPGGSPANSTDGVATLYVRSAQDKPATVLCTLAHYDVYTPIAPRKRAPTRYCFAVKAQHRLGIHDEPLEASYIHFFCTEDQASMKEWVLALRNAKNHVDKHVNPALFDDDAGAAAAGPESAVTTSSAPAAPPSSAVPVSRAASNATAVGRPASYAAATGGFVTGSRLG